MKYIEVLRGTKKFQVILMLLGSQSYLCQLWPLVQVETADSDRVNTNKILWVAYTWLEIDKICMGYSR